MAKELRNITVAFNVTNTEKQQLKQIVEDLNTSLTDYFRDAVFKALKKDEKRINRSDLEEALDTEGKKVFYNGERVR